MKKNQGTTIADGVEVFGPLNNEYRDILTAEAMAFVASLHRRFEERRQELLARRQQIQQTIHKGEKPDFLTETRNVRESHWVVASIPADLQNRRVEITGPVERKMMINAMNSGANVFMADFEDANSPTWDNVVTGQKNLIDAVRRTLSLTTPEGKQYELADETATLVVRPRGWHLDEKHVTVDDTPVSAALFDFGLYFFHNAQELLNRNTGPYYYLPKLENHLEARLWNEVFVAAQDSLNIPKGTIKSTVLIETILAAYEMEEILYELRDHMAALNAGRWDYIFSAIKKFRRVPGFVLPDRAQVTMTVPFMRAYTDLLVHSCHKHGAHAIGGMAAFIPSRKDPKVNEIALARVREDKEREAADGFDGTWVAHPDLVPVAAESFNRVLGDRPHQKDKLRDEIEVTAADLIHFEVPGGTVTETGVRNNISVAIQYVESWLRGQGAVAINNLMEDAATAEIARSQLWQWIHSGARLDNGRSMSRQLYRAWVPEELTKIKEAIGEDLYGQGRFEEARKILDDLVETTEFTDFLTWPAYRLLD